MAASLPSSFGASPVPSPCRATAEPASRSSRERNAGVGRCKARLALHQGCFIFQEKGVNEVLQQDNWISWLLLASQPLCGRTCGHRGVPASVGPAGEAARGQPGEEAGVNSVRAMHFCSVRRFGWVSFILRLYVSLDDTKLLFANGFDLFTVIGFNKWEILSLH